MFRNPAAAMLGPLERFQGRRASADELLGLASPAALGQLAGFREVFASALLPQLASRPGRWVLGAEFAGSALMKADADVIAAGLLLDLKTDVEAVPRRHDDAPGDRIRAARLRRRVSAHARSGTFSARYGYLATWDLASLLDELAGRSVNLRSSRDEFRLLLLDYQ